MLTGRGRAHHGDILLQGARLADAGKLTPLLDPRHFTLETALEAHLAVESGKAVGKIVVDIAG
jgi:NADPH:quinone reductase-like Zn-dependent oxidoreductase